MRKQYSKLTLCGFIICLLVTVKANGQRNISNSYCLGCCGLNAYQLVLFDNQSFEIRSTYSYKGAIDTLPYVRGRYVLTRKEIMLDIESVREKVEIKKIKESESLILHMDIVSDTDDMSILGTSVIFKERRRHGYVFTRSGQIIEMPFDIGKTLLFNFPGMNTLEYTFTEPGEYMLKVTMIQDIKMMLRAGERKTFKRVSLGKEEKLQDSADKRIKFVTKKCEPVITKAY